jgi:uncharacterized membrane protein
MSSPTARLDAFADAAFAFAVSLMVVGGSGPTPDYDGLVLAMRAIPSFVIGFAFIAMFWFAHVRWRKLRGEGDWRSVILTLALILSVLIYVHPLRAMSASFAAYLSGSEDSFADNLPQMFAIYGTGFVVMAGLMAALYHDVLRRADLPSMDRPAVLGEAIIWLILVGTGLVSIIMTQIPVTAYWAPFAYATLPLTIGVFAMRWQWSEPEQDSAA